MTEPPVRVLMIATTRPFSVIRTRPANDGMASSKSPGKETGCP